jgi:hypothetical protein
LRGGNDILDARVFGSLMVYPQPLGFAAEYTAGRGPSQGKNNPTIIDDRPLHGGYAQLMYKLDGVLGQSFIPYVRGQFYTGGKKFETNAPRYDILELESGVEWQVSRALEIVLAYTLADRTSSSYPYASQQGHITRVQVQVNY